MNCLVPKLTKKVRNNTSKLLMVSSIKTCHGWQKASRFVPLMDTAGNFTAASALRKSVFAFLHLRGRKEVFSLCRSRHLFSICLHKEESELNWRRNKTTHWGQERRAIYDWTWRVNKTRQQAPDTGIFLFFLFFGVFHCVLYSICCLLMCVNHCLSTEEELK